MEKVEIKNVHVLAILRCQNTQYQGGFYYSISTYIHWISLQTEQHDNWSNNCSVHNSDRYTGTKQKERSGSINGKKTDRNRSITGHSLNIHESIES